MSSIIFEGNTYTFGATVSANPGTGTTSYVFGGLSSGWTYGFIIWAFNGFGNSNITGPVTIFTPSFESRQTIFVFSEYWPSSYVSGGAEKISSLYTTRSNFNLLMPSEAPLNAIEDSNWDGINNSSVQVVKGFTSPVGSTTASYIWYKPFTTGISFPHTLSGADDKGYSQLRLGVTSGSTYTFSFYLNYDLGSAPLILGSCAGWTTSSHIYMDWRGATTVNGSYSSLSPRQILPVTTNASGLSLGGGLSGWQRMAYEIYFDPGVSFGLCYFLFSSSAASSQIKAGGYTFYVWGMQLEQRTGSGPTAYSPNILDSYNFETTAEHDNVFWNFTTDQGMTYIWPQVVSQFKKFDGTRSSLTDSDYAAISQGEFWKNYNVNQDFVLKNDTKLLNGLPSKRKSIRPYGYDVFPFDSFIEDRVGTGTTGMKSWSFYDSSFSRTGTTGYYPSLWPSSGITAGLCAWNSFITYLGSTVADLNYLLSDREGVIFDFLPIEPSNPYSVDPKHFQTTISSDAKYSQSWYGLTAISSWMNQAGVTITNFTDLYFSKQGVAWSNIVHTYAARAARQFLSPALSTVYPNAYFADYGEFYTSANYFDGPGTQPDFLRREPVINSSSPVLYATNSINGVCLWYADTRYTNDYQRYITDVELKNKIAVSETYQGTASWSNLGSTLIAGVQDPLGTNRAYNLIDGSTTNLEVSHLYHAILYQNASTANVPGSNSYTISSYFRPGITDGATYGVISYGHFAGNRYFLGTVVYDLLAGIPVGTIATALNSPTGYFPPGYTYSYGMTYAGNSWYRCWISPQGFTISSNDTFVSLGHSNTASPTYELTGAAYRRVQYTGSNGKQLYIWGTQIETGVTSPTDYVPRGGSFSSASTVSLPNDGWLAFATEIQNLRNIKRASPSTAIVPWIANVSWPGDGLVGATATRPTIGWSDTVQGFNPKQGCTFTVAGGNSAYYFEFVRHLMLHGVPAISLWPGTVFSYGSLSNQAYFNAGYTTYIQEYKDLDACAHDVNSKIGGFTLTTADYSRIDYLAKYVASGAPAPSGSTWWWRVTVGVSGSRVLVNGETLDSVNGPYGTWVSTTGPTLAYVPITIL